MMDVRMTEESEGARAARQRDLRHWRTTGLAMLGGVGVSLIMLMGKSASGRIQPTYAIATVIAMAILLPMVVHFNGRTKDELGRLNALKANSFGLYACMLGGWSWLVLYSGGLAPPPNMIFLIVATGLITLARYTMLKMGL